VKADYSYFRFRCYIVLKFTDNYQSYILTKLKKTLRYLRAGQFSYEEQIEKAKLYYENFIFTVGSYDMPIQADCRRCGISICSMHYFWGDVNMHMKGCKKPIMYPASYIIYLNLPH
jgi:hypothetical protein